MKLAGSVLHNQVQVISGVLGLTRLINGSILGQLPYPMGDPHNVYKLLFI